jgi:hypothetical protein
VLITTMRLNPVKSFVWGSKPAPAALVVALWTTLSKDCLTLDPIVWRFFNSRFYLYIVRSFVCLSVFVLVLVCLFVFCCLFDIVGTGCGQNNQNYLWQVSTQDFVIRYVIDLLSERNILNYSYCFTYDEVPTYITITSSNPNYPTLKWTFSNWQNIAPPASALQIPSFCHC